MLRSGRLSGPGAGAAPSAFEPESGRGAVIQVIFDDLYLECVSGPMKLFAGYALRQGGQPEALPFGRSGRTGRTTVLDIHR